MMTLLMTIQNKKFFTDVLKTKADGEGGLGQSGELARSSEVGRAALPPHIWLTLKCAMLGPARGQGPVCQWARGQWAPAEACQAKIQSWVTVLIFQ